MPPKLSRYQRVQQHRVGEAGGDAFDAFGDVFGDADDPIFSRSPVELGRIDESDLSDVGDVGEIAGDDDELGNAEVEELMERIRSNADEIDRLKSDIDVSKLKTGIKANDAAIDRLKDAADAGAAALRREYEIAEAKANSSPSGLWWVAGGLVALVLYADATRGKAKAKKR